MPLIDDEFTTHDPELTENFWSIFTVNNDNSIVDSKLKSWILFQNLEFMKWIHCFESLVGIPIGRIVHNSAADAEEVSLSDFGEAKYRFFAHKKFRKDLENRWALFGWGSPLFPDSKIRTNLFPAVAAGFFLASKEKLETQRFKIEWNQYHETQINCKFTHIKDKIPPPKGIENLPWCRPFDVNKESRPPAFNLESQKVGWSVEGDSMFVIPCQFFNRLIGNVVGYGGDLESDLARKWDLNGIEENINQSLIYAFVATKEVFLQSNVHVYLQDKHSWYSVIKAHLNQYGLGGIVNISENNDSTIFVLKLLPSLPLTIGKLVGLWERAYGKESRCKISFENDSVELEISSLLEYV